MDDLLSDLLKAMEERLGPFGVPVVTILLVLALITALAWMWGVVRREVIHPALSYWSARSRSHRKHQTTQDWLEDNLSPWDWDDLQDTLKDKHD